MSATPRLRSRVPVDRPPDDTTIAARASAFYDDLKVMLAGRKGLSSRRAGWSQEVVVERWSLPPMEWPDHTMPRHRVGVVVSSNPHFCTWTDGDGRWRKGTYVPGAINVMPDGLTTRARWNSQVELTTFEFSPALIGRLAGSGAASAEQLIESRGVHDAFAHDAAMRITAELAAPTESLYGEMLCLALAVHLVRRYGRTSGHVSEFKGRLSQVQARRVLEYMRANLEGRLTVSALAREAGLSEACFARAFRATFQEPPHRLVLRWRLERAVRLVAKTGCSLADAATGAGFCDQAHLTNAMRRHFGRTPGTWRRDLE